MPVSYAKLSVLRRVMLDMHMDVTCLPSEYEHGALMLRVREDYTASFDVLCLDDGWFAVLLRPIPDGVYEPAIERRPYWLELEADARPRDVAMRVLEEVFCGRFLLEDTASEPGCELDERYLEQVAESIADSFDDFDIPGTVHYWRSPWSTFDVEFEGFEAFQLQAGHERWSFLYGADGGDHDDVPSRAVQRSPLWRDEFDDGVFAAEMLSFVLTTLAPTTVGQLSPINMTPAQEAVVRNAYAFLRHAATERDDAGVTARMVLERMRA